MAEDILALLKLDHEKVANILEKMADTSNGAIKTREKFFEQLKDAFVQHEKFEEEVFYPAVKERGVKSSETKEVVLQAYQEHHLADVLLNEMESLACDDETWMAKLKVLKESIHHHVHEEEENLFAKVKKAFSNDELKEMADKLKKWQKDQKSQS